MERLFSLVRASLDSAQLQALAAIAERLAAQGPFTARQFHDASGVG